jgi:hypothetical protein
MQNVKCKMSDNAFLHFAFRILHFVLIWTTTAKT